MLPNGFSLLQKKFKLRFILQTFFFLATCNFINIILQKYKKMQYSRSIWDKCIRIAQLNCICILQMFKIELKFDSSMFFLNYALFIIIKRNLLYKTNK